MGDEMTLGEQTHSTVWFQVLGPLEVLVHGEPIPLGGVKQRSVLAMLLCEPNRVVSADSMAEELWPATPTDKARSTLHVHLSNLRRRLITAAEALGRTEIIVTKAPGYRIAVNEEQLDLLALDAYIKQAKSLLANARPAEAAKCYETAIELWKGVPLSDLVDEPFAQRATLRLRALRLRAVEGRLEAYIAAGLHEEVVSELENLVALDPMNERFVEFLMIALYRSGRQSDALAAYRACRLRLDEELGLQPRQTLRDLESRILLQDPKLEGRSAAEDDISAPTLLPGDSLQPHGALIWNGARFDLVEKVTTIGRRKDRSVFLADAEASREHAEIIRDAGGFRLIDNKSSNGTRVNGVMIREHLLRDGDEILIGQTSMQFRTTVT